MVTKVVPTMSDRGFVTHPAEKADALLAYFFQDDETMHYLLSGAVQNIQILMQRYGNDIPRLCQQFGEALTTRLQGSFDFVDVAVTSDDVTDGNPSGNITLKIQIKLVDGGQTYSIERLVRSVNSKFTIITNYLNYGTLPATTN